MLQQPERFAEGLPYSLGLLLILGAHELGHYFTAKAHGIRVTPPFFIPVPFALGTFGAFIKIKSLTPNRRALFDVAVAGPLAGLVFAIPALLIGLRFSEVIPGNAPSGLGDAGVNIGSSVLLAGLAKLSLGASALEGSHLLLHPLAFAGWLGLIVTALNLLPIGQLDGGHLSHALFGSRNAHGISLVAMASLFLLALFVWPGLMFWAFIVFFMRGHAGRAGCQRSDSRWTPAQGAGLFHFPAATAHHRACAALALRGDQRLLPASLTFMNSTPPAGHPALLRVFQTKDQTRAFYNKMRVFMSFTLGFDTPEIPKVLNERQRVLRPGGRILVVGMSRAGPKDPLVKVFEWTQKHSPKFLDCRPIYVRRALEEAGFIIRKALIQAHVDSGRNHPGRQETSAQMFPRRTICDN